jgi:hypothetical protein
MLGTGNKTQKEGRGREKCMNKKRRDKKEK